MWSNYESSKFVLDLLPLDSLGIIFPQKYFIYSYELILVYV